MVFIFRGACDFATKAKHAVAAGAVALVVINHDQSRPDYAFSMVNTSRKGENEVAPAAELSEGGGRCPEQWEVADPVRDGVMELGACYDRGPAREAAPVPGRRAAIHRECERRCARRFEAFVYVPLLPLSMSRLPGPGCMFHRYAKTN